MNTIEGNKLIAEFVSMRVDTHGGETWIVGHNGNEIWHNENSDNWLFHISWDWLMPVVEKINTIDYYSYDVIIFRSDCHINDREQILFESSILTKKDTIIEVVWGCVVNFIEWYNSNKAPKGGKKEGE